MCTKHHFNSISYFISVAKISVIIILLWMISLHGQEVVGLVSCTVERQYNTYTP